MFSYSVDTQLRSPFPGALVEGDTAKWRGTALIAMQPITLIDVPADIAEICDSVVGSLPVDMVDLSLGPFSMNIEPCQAIGAVQLPPGTDIAVALGIDRPNWLSLAGENPSLRVIVENGSEICDIHSLSVHGNDCAVKENLAKILERK